MNKDVFGDQFLWKLERVRHIIEQKSCLNWSGSHVTVFVVDSCEFQCFSIAVDGGDDDVVITTQKIRRKFKCISVPRNSKEYDVTVHAQSKPREFK